MKISKKVRVLLALCLVCAIVSGALAAAGMVISRGSGWTGAEKAWAGEGDARYTQTAVFFPIGQERTQEDIRNFRKNLTDKLQASSLDAIYEGNLTRDAYWGTGKLNLTGGRGSATVDVLAVGGDFFFFHPYELKNGSYITEDDLMHDGIVLDEDTAWRLFGGTDLEGLTVTYGDKQLRVAGVVKLEDDFATEAARGEQALAFVHYDLLYDSYAAGVEGIELVLPDPVGGFGLNIVKELFANEAKAVEITGRLGLSGAVDVIGDFGLRSMEQDGIRYPYWENALRMREDVMSLLWLLAFVFGLLPAVVLIAAAILGIRYGVKFGVKQLKEKGESAREEHRERQYQKQQAEKEKIPAEEGQTWQA